MTRNRRFFASSPWIATGTPDYVNLGYTSRGLAKQALMRLSPKSLAIFRKLGLGLLSGHIKQEDFLRENQPFANAFDKIVRDGRLLEAVSIDHCPERDDDWIEFSFSDPDAAVARFRRRRESTGA